MLSDLTLKREYTMANYLSTIKCPKLRKMLTTYRLSEHSLAIETELAPTDSAPSVTGDRSRQSCTF